MVVAAWFGLKWLIQQFIELDSDVSKALMGAGGAVLVSVVTVVYGKHIEQEKKIEFEVRTKKIPVYEEFVDFFIELIQGVKDKKKKVTPKRMEDFVFTWSKKVLIWGSDEVVSAWSNYRRNASQITIKEQFAMLETMLKAMRKDVGHSGKRMKKGDLLGLVVNDIGKYI